MSANIEFGLRVCNILFFNASCFTPVIDLDFIGSTQDIPVSTQPLVSGVLSVVLFWSCGYCFFFNQNYVHLVLTMLPNQTSSFVISQQSLSMADKLLVKSDFHLCYDWIAVEIL